MGRTSECDWRRDGALSANQDAATNTTSWHPARRCEAAFKDAGVDYGEIQQAYAGYVYGDSTCGQRAVYEVGLTGIPVFNVNNNCSTGSTALMLGKQAIEGGIAECVLVVGFEQMERGALASKFNGPDAAARASTFDVMGKVQVVRRWPDGTAQMFGGAGREYRWKYGMKKRNLRAGICEGAKARRQEPVRTLPGRTFARRGDELA